MRCAFAAILIAFSLLLSGCIGSGEPAPSAGNESGLAAPGERAQAPQPEMPQAPLPDAAWKNGSAPAASNAARPDYVNYCYPTYWKGTLEGSGRNNFDYSRCGDYNYSMEISVIFTVPFDLAAYLAGKDFNFNDCPGLPAGAANGSRDISIDGSFSSTREITSQAANVVDRKPDMQTASSGNMYISWPQGLVFATYPRQDAQAVASGAKKYPHMIVDRCTWSNGLQTQGYDEAVIFGADGRGVADPGGMRTITGKWAMNGTLAGNYTLERTD